MTASRNDQDHTDLPLHRRGRPHMTMPFPSMPLAYWNDPDGERYQSAYFSRYPNTWWHGDWAEITEHGGVIIYGRSDSTLNVRGIRIGSAEIYRPLATIPEIVESVVVAQEMQGDSRIILFVRLRDDAVFNEDLDRLIRDSIRSAASPRHVPACIVAVPDIPRTYTGKASEAAVRDAVNGKDVRNRKSISNPQSLAFFTDVGESKT